MFAVAGTWTMDASMKEDQLRALPMLGVERGGLRIVEIRAEA